MARSDVHFWEGCQKSVIEAEKLSFSECAAFLAPPTATEVATWQQSTVLDWVREAMHLRSQVYAMGDGQLGYAYRSQQMPTVKERLLRAGVRLAGLLNTIFSGR